MWTEIYGVAEFLSLYESFEFHLAVDDFDDILDIAAIFLLSEIFRFFQDEFVEARARKLRNLFSGLLLRLHEGLVELVDLFAFTLRLGACYAEGSCGGRRGGFERLGRLILRLALGSLLRAFGLDGFRGRTEMALDAAFFLLLRFLAENVFVLGVGLREVIQAETLAVFEVAAALAVAFDRQFDAPFDFRRRTLSAAPEILVVFDLELADVALELAQILVDGRHGWKCPLKYHARR